MALSTMKIRLAIAFGIVVAASAFLRTSTAEPRVLCVKRAWRIGVDKSFLGTRAAIETVPCDDACYYSEVRTIRPGGGLDQVVYTAFGCISDKNDTNLITTGRQPSSNANDWPFTRFLNSYKEYMFKFNSKAKDYQANFKFCNRAAGNAMTGKCDSDQFIWCKGEYCPVQPGPKNKTEPTPKPVEIGLDVLPGTNAGDPCLPNAAVAVLRGTRGSEPYTFTMGTGSDSALFKLSATGELTAVSKLVDSQTYTVPITVVDVKGSTVVVDERIAVKCWTNGNPPVAPPPVVITGPTPTQFTAPSCLPSAVMGKVMAAKGTGTLRFEMYGGADAKSFSIDSVTGEITSINTLSTRAYTIRVLVVDAGVPPTQAIETFTITASCSEQPGQSLQANYKAFTVTSSGGCTAGTVLGMIETSGGKPPYSYSVKPGNDAELFDVLDGRLRAVTKLPSKLYAINVEVHDSVNAIASSSAQFSLNCEIMDNKTKPLVFTGPAPLIIPKECASNVTIATMTAEGGLGNRRFEMLGGKDASLFTVNSVTGEITTLAPLQGQMYDIRVLAGDESEPKRYVEEIFHINAINCSAAIVKPPPKFSAPVASLSTANCSLGAVIASVQANGGMVPLHYEMFGGADAGLFSVDARTGEISAVAALAANSYSIRVQVADATVPSQTDVVNVTIQANCVSTGGPLTATYVNASALCTKGSVPATVQAAGGKAPYTYAIDTSEDSNSFDIMDGRIRATSDLKPKLYSLPVVVRDAAGASFNLTVLFTMNCQATNGIVITGPSTQIQPINCAKDQTIAAVTASGGKEPRQFQLFGGPDASTFNVDATSGVITTLTNLTARPYTIRVLVSDSSTPKVTAEEIFTINAANCPVDEKDIGSQPRFPPNMPTSIAVEKCSLNAPLPERLQAITNGSVGNLTYEWQQTQPSLVSHNNSAASDNSSSSDAGAVFEYRPATGEVVAKLPPRRGARYMYTLKATNTASGLSATTAITLTIQCLNSPPSMSATEYSFNATVCFNNTIVPQTTGAINTTDPDGDRVQYVWKAVAEDKFAMNATTGEITVASEPHRNKRFVYQIFANDSKGELSNPSLVIISTPCEQGGLNDPPRFTAMQDVFIIRQCAPNANNTARRVGQVLVTDSDEDTFSYTLVNNATDEFQVNALTGEITSSATFKKEQNVVLTVEARDARGASSTTSVTIQIKCYEPQFDEPSYMFPLAGSTCRGGTTERYVGSIGVIDRDGGLVKLSIKSNTTSTSENVNVNNLSANNTQANNTVPPTPENNPANVDTEKRNAKANEDLGAEEEPTNATTSANNATSTNGTAAVPKKRISGRLDPIKKEGDLCAAGASVGMLRGSRGVEPYTYALNTAGGKDVALFTMDTNGEIKAINKLLESREYAIPIRIVDKENISISAAVRYEVTCGVPAMKNLTTPTNSTTAANSTTSNSTASHNELVDNHQSTNSTPGAAPVRRIGGHLVEVKAEGDPCAANITVGHLRGLKGVEPYTYFLNKTGGRDVALFTMDESGEIRSINALPESREYAIPIRIIDKENITLSASIKYSVICGVPKNQTTLSSSLSNAVKLWRSANDAVSVAWLEDDNLEGSSLHRYRRAISSYRDSTNPVVVRSVNDQFTINEHGEIFVTGDIANPQQIPLTVVATDDEGAVTERTVTIDARCNNNAPQWTGQTHFEIVVPAEQCQNGTSDAEIARISARDQDRDKISYVFTSPAMDTAGFTLAAESGALRFAGMNALLAARTANMNGTGANGTTPALNSTIMFEMTARDAFGSEATPRATVSVNIRACTNAAPKFALPEYQFAVTLCGDRKGAAYYLGRVEAKDEDEDKMTYKVVKQPESGSNYTIDESGNLTTTSVFKKSANETIVIEASDSNGAKATTNVQIRITCEGPVFDTNKTDFTMQSTFMCRKNATNPRVVGQASARDPDGGPVKYSIRLSTANGTDVQAPDHQFNIDPNSGEISTFSDFKVEAVVQLNVAAEDDEGETAVGVITLNLKCANQQPNFTANDYQNLTITREQCSSGAFVTVLNATDPDGDVVRFELGNSSKSHFNISDGNRLNLMPFNQSVAMTMNTTYVTVNAIDTLDGVTTIQIPVNTAACMNSPPVVRLPLPPMRVTQCSALVSNATTSGTRTVGQLDVFDADNDTLSYNITQPENSKFDISANGTITTSSNFITIGEVTLRVEIDDHRTQPPIVQEVKIDINCPPPVFDPRVSAQPLVIPQSQCRGGKRVIGLVQASDLDGGHVQYYLADELMFVGGGDFEFPEEAPAMNSTQDAPTNGTQNVPTNGTQNATTNGTQNATATGSNNATTNGTALPAKVREANFTLGQNSTSANSTTIAKNKRNGNTTFIPFHVEHDTGYVYTTYNFSTPFKTKVDVVARDDEGANATITVEIDVQCIDEAPRFTKPVYTAHLQRHECKPNSTIESLNIQAFDIELDTNITYAISKPDANNMFTIDATTGKVSVRHRPENENGTSLALPATAEFEITAQDSNAKKSTSATVKLDLRECSNKAPVPLQSEYTLKLKSSDQCQRSTQLTPPIAVQDPDSDNITYAIEPPSKHVMIDPINGTITVLPSFFTPENKGPEKQQPGAQPSNTTSISNATFTWFDPEKTRFVMEKRWTCIDYYYGKEKRLVGQVHARDPDGNGTVKYTMKYSERNGNETPAYDREFSIDEQTGEIKTLFNFNNDTTVKLNVTGTTGSGKTHSQDVTIDIKCANPLTFGSAGESATGPAVDPSLFHVVARDSGGAQVSIPVRIDSSACSNQPPTIDGSYTFEIFDCKDGSILDTIVARDPNNDPLSFNITGPYASNMTINENGTLSFVGSFSEPKEPVFTVHVTVSDGKTSAGLLPATDVTINATRCVNHPPQLPRNKFGPFVVGRDQCFAAEKPFNIISARDNEGDIPLKFTLTGAGSEMFGVDAEGKIYARADLTRPMAQSVTKQPLTFKLVAEDTKGLRSAPPADVIVDATECINLPPKILKPQRDVYYVTQQQCLEAGVNVVSIIANDDEADWRDEQNTTIPKLTYTLSGTDYVTFLSADKGKIVIQRAITKPITASKIDVAVTVKDSDGLSSSTTFKLDISACENVAQPPLHFVGEPYKGELLQCTAGSVVGGNLNVKAVDDTNAGAAIKYALEGENGETHGMKIDASTGKISAETEVNPQKPNGEVVVRVVATTSDGKETRTLVHIAVKCSRAPRFPTTELIARVIDCANGSLVNLTMFKLDDEDTANGNDNKEFKWAITGGEAASKVELVKALSSAPPQIRLTSAAKVSDMNETFTLQVTDSTGLSSSVVIPLNVKQCNKPPTFSSPNRTYALDVTNCNINANVSDSFDAVDPDEGDVLSYSITETDSAFKIANPSKGLLYVADNITLKAKSEKKEKIMLHVVVTDRNGLQDTATVTLNPICNDTSVPVPFDENLFATNVTIRGTVGGEDTSQCSEGSLVELVQPIVLTDPVSTEVTLIKGGEDFVYNSKNGSLTLLRRSNATAEKFVILEAKKGNKTERLRIDVQYVCRPLPTDRLHFMNAPYIGEVSQCRQNPNNVPLVYVSGVDVSAWDNETNSNASIRYQFEGYAYGFGINMANGDIIVGPYGVPPNQPGNKVRVLVYARKIDGGKTKESRHYVNIVLKCNDTNTGPQPPQPGLLFNQGTSSGTVGSGNQSQCAKGSQVQLSTPIIVNDQKNTKVEIIQGGEDFEFNSATGVLSLKHDLSVSDEQIVIISGTKDDHTEQVRLTISYFCLPILKPILNFVNGPYETTITNCAASNEEAGIYNIIPGLNITAIDPANNSSEKVEYFLDGESYGVGINVHHGVLIVGFDGLERVDGLDTLYLSVNASTENRLKESHAPVTIHLKCTNATNNAVVTFAQPNYQFDLKGEECKNPKLFADKMHSVFANSSVPGAPVTYTNVPGANQAARFTVNSANGAIGLTDMTTPFTVRKTDYLMVNASIVSATNPSETAAMDTTHVRIVIDCDETNDITFLKEPYEFVVKGSACYNATDFNLDDFSKVQATSKKWSTFVYSSEDKKFKVDPVTGLVTFISLATPVVSPDVVNGTFDVFNVTAKPVAQPSPPAGISMNANVRIVYMCEEIRLPTIKFAQDLYTFELSGEECKTPKLFADKMYKVVANSSDGAELTYLWDPPANRTARPLPHTLAVDASGTIVLNGTNTAPLTHRDLEYFQISATNANKTTSAQTHVRVTINCDPKNDITFSSDIYEFYVNGSACLNTADYFIKNTRVNATSKNFNNRLLYTDDSDVFTVDPFTGVLTFYNLEGAAVNKTAQNATNPITFRVTASPAKEFNSAANLTTEVRVFFNCIDELNATAKREVVFNQTSYEFELKGDECKNPKLFADKQYRLLATSERAGAIPVYTEIPTPGTGKISRFTVDASGLLSIDSPLPFTARSREIMVVNATFDGITNTTQVLVTVSCDPKNDINFENEASYNYVIEGTACTDANSFASLNYSVKAKSATWQKLAYVDISDEFNIVPSTGALVYAKTDAASLNNHTTLRNGTESFVDVTASPDPQVSPAINMTTHVRMVFNCAAPNETSQKILFDKPEYTFTLSGPECANPALFASKFYVINAQSTDAGVAVNIERRESELNRFTISTAGILGLNPNDTSAFTKTYKDYLTARATTSHGAVNEARVSILVECDEDNDIRFLNEPYLFKVNGSMCASNSEFDAKQYKVEAKSAKYQLEYQLTSNNTLFSVDASSGAIKTTGKESILPKDNSTETVLRITAVSKPAQKNIMTTEVRIVFDCSAAVVPPNNSSQLLFEKPHYNFTLSGAECQDTAKFASKLYAVKAIKPTDATGNVAYAGVPFSLDDTSIAKPSGRFIISPEGVITLNTSMNGALTTRFEDFLLVNASVAGNAALVSQTDVRILVDCDAGNDIAFQNQPYTITISGDECISPTLFDNKNFTVTATTSKPGAKLTYTHNSPRFTVDETTGLVQFQSTDTLANETVDASFVVTAYDAANKNVNITATVKVQLQCTPPNATDPNKLRFEQDSLDRTFVQLQGPACRAPGRRDIEGADYEATAAPGTKLTYKLQPKTGRSGGGRNPNNAAAANSSSCGAASIKIDENTGQLYVEDFCNSVYNVRVDITATDGKETTPPITVHVQINCASDNYPPRFRTATYGVRDDMILRQCDEPRRVVATVTATDQDTVDMNKLTYALRYNPRPNDPEPMFAVDEQTGAIYKKEGMTFTTADNGKTFKLYLRAYDTLNQTANTKVVVTVQCDDALLKDTAGTVEFTDKYTICADDGALKIQAALSVAASKSSTFARFQYLFPANPTGNETFSVYRLRETPELGLGGPEGEGAGLGDVTGSPTKYDLQVDNNGRAYNANKLFPKLELPVKWAHTTKEFVYIADKTSVKAYTTADGTIFVYNSGETDRVKQLWNEQVISAVSGSAETEVSGKKIQLQILKSDLKTIVGKATLGGSEKADLSSTLSQELRAIALTASADHIIMFTETEYAYGQLNKLEPSQAVKELPPWTKLSPAGLSGCSNAAKINDKEDAAHAIAARQKTASSSAQSSNATIPSSTTAANQGKTPKFDKDLYQFEAKICNEGTKIGQIKATPGASNPTATLTYTLTSSDPQVSANVTEQLADPMVLDSKDGSIMVAAHTKALGKTSTLKYTATVSDGTSTAATSKVEITLRCTYRPVVNRISAPFFISKDKCKPSQSPDGTVTATDLDDNNVVASFKFFGKADPRFKFDKNNIIHSEALNTSEQVNVMVVAIDAGGLESEPVKFAINIDCAPLKSQRRDTNKLLKFDSNGRYQFMINKDCDIAKARSVGEVFAQWYGERLKTPIIYKFRNYTTEYSITPATGIITTTSKAAPTTANKLLRVIATATANGTYTVEAEVHIVVDCSVPPPGVCDARFVPGALFRYGTAKAGANIGLFSGSQSHVFYQIEMTRQRVLNKNGRRVAATFVTPTGVNVLQGKIVKTALNDGQGRVVLIVQQPSVSPTANNTRTTTVLAKYTFVYDAAHDQYVHQPQQEQLVSPPVTSSMYDASAAVTYLTNGTTLKAFKHRNETGTPIAQVSEAFALKDSKFSKFQIDAMTWYEPLVGTPGVMVMSGNQFALMRFAVAANKTISITTAQQAKPLSSLCI